MSHGGLITVNKNSIYNEKFIEELLLSLEWFFASYKSERDGGKEQDRREGTRQAEEKFIIIKKDWKVYT